MHNRDYSTEPEQDSDQVDVQIQAGDGTLRTRHRSSSTSHDEAAGTKYPFAPGAPMTVRAIASDSQKENTHQKDEQTPENTSQTLTGRWFRRFRRKHHVMPHKPTVIDHIKNILLCPPIGRFARTLTLLLLVLLLWGVLWSLTREAALPGGYLFALLAVVVLSMIGGWLVTFIRLPALLGMLVMGVLLRNLPVVNIAKDLDRDLSSVLRNVALVVILIRAGLGLDPVALRRLAFVCIRLALTPCLVECITVAIMSHLLLGFPWEWGFLLGFVLAAVSPAVVVPSLISIQQQGLGVAKGIPTLVIAAASVDDVLAISGFSVVLGIAFSSGSLAWSIGRGPLELLLGISFGWLAGVITWYLPNFSEGNVVLQRFLLLFGGGLFSVFASKAVEVSGAGALGCLSMAFVSAYHWRKQGWTDGNNPVADIMAALWVVFQPTLFGLIGAEIDIHVIQLQTIGLGVAVLAVGLFFRLIASVCAVSFAGFSWKEKGFISLAWLPKATVQAAIGSIALETARERDAGAVKEDLGLQVLTIAVLVILITAPIGAAAIALSAPRLLTHDATYGQESSPTRANEHQPVLSEENACDARYEISTM